MRTKVYLRANPETSMARIQRRKRPEEAGVKLDDLRLVHQLHEDWLASGKCDVPVAIVDADADPQTVQAAIANLLAPFLAAASRH